MYIYYNIEGNENVHANFASKHETHKYIRRQKPCIRSNSISSVEEKTEEKTKKPKKKIHDNLPIF